MADSGVPLRVVQRVAGHTDPAVTARYLHPDMRALIEAGTAFSVWWGQNGATDSALTDAPRVWQQQWEQGLTCRYAVQALFSSQSG